LCRFRPGRRVAASISRALVEGALHPCRAGAAEAREVAISTFVEGHFGRPPKVFPGGGGGPRSLPIGPGGARRRPSRGSFWQAGGGPRGACRSVQAEPAEDSAKGLLRGLPRRPYGGSVRSVRSVHGGSCEPAAEGSPWACRSVARGPVEGSPYGAFDRSPAESYGVPPRGVCMPWARRTCPGPRSGVPRMPPMACREHLRRVCRGVYSDACRGGHRDRS
jgi:hypothetical protein